MSREEIQDSRGVRRQAGDRILVFKYLYSIYDPRRFDVVVFKAPHAPQENYIKRLVGLPGEMIALTARHFAAARCVARSPSIRGIPCGLPVRRMRRTRRWCAQWPGIGFIEYSSLVRTNERRNDDMTSICVR